MRAFALLLLLMPAVVTAQGTGTLAGRVVDADGMAVPGANVLVEGTTLGTMADGDGNYRILGVPVGEYSVRTSFIGYGSVVQTNVRINDGYTRNLDFVLAQVLVTPGTPIVDCFAPLVSADPFASRVVFGGPSGPGCGFPLPVER
ncbi:MAG TPA: carboxypeptidase-like regulatory domain-containing protein [Rhodothermales bacterium]|nr:carboxypeptidase-like regulatory domain-containing protein [Rhodothermales bacterium]